MSSKGRIRTGYVESGPNIRNPDKSGNALGTNGVLRFSHRPSRQWNDISYFGGDYCWCMYRLCGFGFSFSDHGPRLPLFKSARTDLVSSLCASAITLMGCCLYFAGLCGSF